MTIAEQKAQLRTEMKQKLRKVTEKERAEWSEEICEELYRLVDDSSFQTIGAFYPFVSEPNILPFLHKQIQRGKQIALPYLQKGSETLHFYEVKDWNTLEKGEMGILQPRPEVENEIKTFDVLIIPGIAFDHSGNRLGRSKGIYDQFLTQLLPTLYTIGVCFALQLRKSIPVEPHDQKVKKVVTNERAKTNSLYH